MSLLGLRASPKTIRYAVLEWDGQKVRLINSDVENKLDFPADLLTPEKKMAWLYTELERILRHYPDISVISIKSNEFGPSGATKASRETSYFEGLMLLTAQLHEIPVSLKYYRNLKTNSKSVKKSAEDIVGSLKSIKSFDEKMADAIVVAFSGRQNCD